MVPPATRDAAHGPGAPMPALVLHNFTSLEFPSRLADGRALECRKSGSLKDIYPFSILAVTPEYLQSGGDYDFLFQHVGVMLWDPRGEVTAPGAPLPPWVDMRLSPRPGEAELAMACEHMLRLLELKEQCLELHNANAVTEARNRQLNQVGMALMSERNLDTLLNLILEKAMELTGSDAGCLYLVEPREGGEERPDDYWADKRIRFKLTRNWSVAFDFTEITMAPSRASIGGFVMLEGKPLNIPDVYSLPETAAFRHNHGFDATSGYRTRSMLALPMKDHRGRVVGAIQLINKCRNKIAPITSVEAADRYVLPYSQEDLNLSLSLASQASVAILNAQYERDIQKLFEGFINASVTAIESRDPTTSGHSQRVADYCLRMAGALERLQEGKFRGVRFTEAQLREIRYAALLHDFGKIGVREHVLVKAKKLFPEELERIRLRADFIKRTIQWEMAEGRNRILGEALAAHAGHAPGACACRDPASLVQGMESEEARRLAEVDGFLEILAKANEPMRLTGDMETSLKDFGARTFKSIPGGEDVWLHPDEIVRLMIPKGTLSREERIEIESHVTHTYKFLSRIPWTADLRLVPLIAYAHHEKLDGTGYPRRLDPGGIPLPSQLMTICDIYDALTAADRPYKKAIPSEKALDILGFEVKEGKIDPELFRIFKEARIYLPPG